MSCSGLKALGYYDSLLAQINNNLETEAYEENLLLKEKLLTSEAFLKLPCHLKGKIFHKIGISYYWLNREDEAIDCFENLALKSWKDCDGVPESERANTIYNIGISYQYLGNNVQAKKYLDEAIYIFENDPDYPPLRLGNYYNGIANFYLENLDAFRAELYFENSLNVLKDVEDSEALQFEVLNRFLILCIDFKKYEKADSIISRALSLAEEFPNSISSYDLAFLYQNAGIYYFELEDFEQASKLTMKGLELIDPQETPDLYAEAIEKIALIKSESEKFDETIELLNEVVQTRKALLSTLETYQALAYAYENLAEVHQKKGDYAKAHRHLQQAFKYMMINGKYDKSGIPVVNQSILINDLDMVRQLSIKANIYEDQFEVNGQEELLEKSLSLYAKIDTLISKNILFFQFEASKLNFLELIQSYYGKGINTALKLRNKSGVLVDSF
ncbi:MAG: tetratricopeptide repeat protein [Bacteroidota bacterium]